MGQVWPTFYVFVGMSLTFKTLIQINTKKLNTVYLFQNIISQLDVWNFKSSYDTAYATYTDQRHSRVIHFQSWSRLPLFN